MKKCKKIITIIFVISVMFTSLFSINVEAKKQKCSHKSILKIYGSDGKTYISNDVIPIEAFKGATYKLTGVNKKNTYCGIFIAEPSQYILGEQPYADWAYDLFFSGSKAIRNKLRKQYSSYASIYKVTSKVKTSNEYEFIMNNKEYIYLTFILQPMTTKLKTNY